MPNSYAEQDDCTSELGKKIQYWRVDRPSEWIMDDLIRAADKVSSQLDEAKALLAASDCPQCKDKSGAYYDNNGEVCQCQWCDEVKSLTPSTNLQE